MPRRVGDLVSLSRLTYRSNRLSPLMLWFRHRGIRPVDRFVASYPRSGSTWLRFMLFEVMSGASSSFQDVNRAIPDVGWQRHASTRLANGGRLIKTHERYRDAYTAGVYVVRDPRSVAVSEHRWAIGTNLYRKPLDDFVQDFVTGRVHRFGSWAANVESWLDGVGGRRGNLLVLRFEDMKEDPIGSLRSACRFLGIPASAAGLERAVENTSIQNMRLKEQIAGDELRIHREGGRRFINAGSSDGWASFLRPEQILLIEEHAGSLLARLGYPRDSSGLQPSS